MTKKSFSDEAKGFFSSWKSEIEDRDKDILERKKKRDEENEKLNEELKQQFKEVSKDLNDKAKMAFEVFSKEFKGFTEAVKEGSASVYEKLEVEKHANQLSDFLGKVKSKGAEKFKELTENMKKKMDEIDEEELKSEIAEDAIEKTEENDIDLLIQQAQEEYEKSKK
jgi:small-conductance mechanosensitive channel